jgi:NAD(P)-dependent dehydrogenase (short-subunit alcohol dehydrogenase family)
MAAKIQLPGASALVTGAGSGIGRATALTLARAGARVLAVDLDESSAQDTAAACEAAGTEADAYQCDVADWSSVAALADRVHADRGSLGVLVNNAGVGMSGPFTDMSAGDWEWVRSINLDGVLNGCRAFVPAMLGAGQGHVVNLSSVLGYVPSAVAPAYCTTKAAVLMFTRSVRADWGRRGVGASAICPGLINTPIIQRTRFAGPATEAEEEEARKAAQRGFSHGHSPDLVARAILDAIRRDRAVVPVGAEASAAWLLSRLLPAGVTSRLGGPVPAALERALERRRGQRRLRASGSG